MCRCCQKCWEDFYWNCFEEKFCYDESIANYNPDEDEEYIATQKNGSALGRINASDNNNLTVPSPICIQPLRNSNSALISNAKIHEEDYRRETQTNVPMLGPEILAVFANSQIFQDHQPTKLNRISTKTCLTGIHSPNKEIPTTPRESEQDRLLRRLEANLQNGNEIGKGSTPTITTTTTSTTTATNTDADITDALPASPEKRITFTLTPDSSSSPEGSQTLSTPQKFAVIAEEEADADSTRSHASSYNSEQDQQSNEVILRPRLIDRHPHLVPMCASPSSGIGGVVTTPRKLMRSATSVPHFKVRSAASETDIFSITGSTSQISMTPEVPSISFSNLPKNYEDTPTIEKYRVSQSLYSIQTANAARAGQDDYSMPRYFRRSGQLMTQSNEMLAGNMGAGSSTASMFSMSSVSREEVRRPEKEKSKRLQRLRGTLPPLLVHSVSFRKNRDEAKQVD